MAGIAFSLLLGLALVLVTLSSPANPAKVGAWLTYSTRRGTIAVALNLVPFAGIAFLWFIGVVRDRIGQHEDRFFGSVFLGSGLLFVAMLFAAAAFAGGLITDVALRAGAAPGPAILALGRQVTGLLLHVYAMRMAAVFTISTTTITFRTQVVPRWIGILGYAIAAVLLVSVGLTPWVELLSPPGSCCLASTSCGPDCGGLPAVPRRLAAHTHDQAGALASALVTEEPATI